MKHRWVLRDGEARTWDCARCGMVRKKLREERWAVSARSARWSVRSVVVYSVGKAEVKHAEEYVPTTEVKP